MPWLESVGWSAIQETRKMNLILRGTMCVPSYSFFGRVQEGQGCPNFLQGFIPLKMFVQAPTLTFCFSLVGLIALHTQKRRCCQMVWTHSPTMWWTQKDCLCTPKSQWTLGHRASIMVPQQPSWRGQDSAAICQSIGLVPLPSAIGLHLPFGCLSRQPEWDSLSPPWLSTWLVSVTGWLYV